MQFAMNAKQGVAPWIRMEHLEEKSMSPDTLIADEVVEIIGDTELLVEEVSIDGLCGVY